MNRLKCSVAAIFIFMSVLLANFPAEASPLHHAAFIGDLELTEMLIAGGADVDERDVNGYTPLLLAIREGHTDLAKVLIANGADVNASAVGDSGKDTSPLDLSVIIDDRELESLLLKKGARR